WDYDPTAPPDGQPVVGQVVVQSLFTGADQDEAATIGADGMVYVYGCAGPAGGGWPTEYGPCPVARVSTAQRSVASDYRYWNGSTWVATASSAVAMGMPDGADGVTNLPPGGFGVTWDATNGVYEMVYSPWPGFTDQLAVRLSLTPQGPWTAPIVVSLP